MVSVVKSADTHLCCAEYSDIERCSGHSVHIGKLLLPRVV